MDTRLPEEFKFEVLPGPDAVDDDEGAFWRVFTQGYILGIASTVAVALAAYPVIVWWMS